MSSPVTGFVWVCLGAGVGAAARYLLDRAITARSGSAFPWGTWTVNVLGSLVLGLLAGVASVADVDEAWALLLGPGLCGGFTTWSTCALEIAVLGRDRPRTAVAYALSSVVVGVAAAGVGWAAGVALG